VALAHGAGGGIAANFGGVTDALGDRWRFLGPNYPGSGTTPVASAPLTFEHLADTVVAAGVVAGATRFPVIGLSLGAAVAVTAAVRHPEHVSALVTTVGLAHTDAQSLAFARAWSAFEAHGDAVGLAHLMLLTCGTTESLAALGAEGVDSLVAEMVRTRGSGTDAHADLVGRVDVRDLLPAIDVPTLVVVAGADRIVLPTTARRFGDIAGAEIVEYPGAGHIFTDTEVDRWAADIGGFLVRATDR
jgi:pimeloyl-ACP methyl ester carboxylesterase